MPMRTVIMVWVVAAVLAVVTALVVTRPGPGASREGPIAQRAVLASEVRELRVQPANQACALMLRREEAIDAWIVEGAGGCSPAWPADASRLRGAVRLLADTLSAPASPAPEFREGETRTRVTITLPEGDRTLLLGEPLGGRAEVFEITANGALLRTVEAGVAQALATASPATWGSPALVQPMPGALASISVSDADGRVTTLSRARGGWWLGEEAASGERVQALLDTTFALRAQGNADTTPAPRDEDLRNSPTTVTVRFAGIPAPGTEAASRPVIEQTVTLASMGTQGVARVPARVEARIVARDTPRTLWARTLFADAGSVGELRADPARLLSRRASPVRRADVGVLVVTPASAETAFVDAPLIPADATAPPARSVRLALREGAWSASGAASELPAHARAAGDAAPSLVTLLLDRDADEVLHTPGGGAAEALRESATTLATVTLASPGGAPLGVVVLGTPAGREGVVLARSRGAVRAYSGEEADALLAWITSLRTE